MLKTVRLTAEEARNRCKHIDTAYHNATDFDADELFSDIIELCCKNSNDEDFEIALFLVRADVERFLTNPNPKIHDNYDPSSREEVIATDYLGVLDLTDGTVGRSNCICHLYQNTFPHSVLRYSKSETEYDVIMDAIKAGDLQPLYKAADAAIASRQ